VTLLTKMKPSHWDRPVWVRSTNWDFSAFVRNWTKISQIYMRCQKQRKLSRLHKILDPSMYSTKYVAEQIKIQKNQQSIRPKYPPLWPQYRSVLCIGR
jgi:hypothetical protein